MQLKPIKLKRIQLTLSADDLRVLSNACAVAGFYYETITIPALQSGNVEELYEFGYAPEEEEAEPGPAAFEGAIALAKESVGEFAEMEEQLEEIRAKAWGKEETE